MGDEHANQSFPTRAGISRRRFLGGAVTMGIGWAALRHTGGNVAHGASLPDPADSGIDHIVVVMMENRSFDHFLGWLPGADGVQKGLTYLDADDMPHATHALAPDFQGCDHPDPDHSYQGGRIEFNNGACDGWLRAGENDDYAIGYYTKRDLDFYAKAGPAWTVCDRYFAAIMAETFPNRIYQHAAQTDRLTNTTDISALPTIWDRLAQARRNGRYYFSDVPVLALWGTTYLPISRPIAGFFADAALGTLPDVAFVDPRFVDEASGTSGDDHPHADIRNGQAFLNQVYAAVTTGPAWARTLLVINYDEWGGFFDHVPPTAAPIPPADQAAGNQDGLRGFRVPCLIVSSLAHGRVSSELFDHTSILRMIEWRWGLDPLTTRDATANNLADALAFGRPKLEAKRFDVPVGPFGAPCLTAAAVADDKWQRLRALAAGFGWPV